MPRRARFLRVALQRLAFSLVTLITPLPNKLILWLTTARDAQVKAFRAYLENDKASEALTR